MWDEWERLGHPGSPAGVVPPAALNIEEPGLQHAGFPSWNLLIGAAVVLASVGLSEARFMPAQPAQPSTRPTGVGRSRQAAVTLTWSQAIDSLGLPVTA